MSKSTSNIPGTAWANDSTLLPGIEPDGRDEAIAPRDSGYEDPAAFYILDKELGWLVKQITDTGAFVTFVSDCCHSASMTRGHRGQRSQGAKEYRRSRRWARAWRGRSQASAR